MNKPNGYDEAQAYGDFKVLPAGGYKCLIKKVACEKTQAGKEYLKIAFDIADGEYKDFYKEKFANDTRDINQKKWSGIWTIFVEGYEAGTTNSKLKGLITSVEKSNNFTFDWNKANNEQDLVGKKVGIVFREEEFIGQDGQIHTSVKPCYAMNYDEVENAKVPNKKTLGDQAFENNYNSADATGDDDLPF